MKRLKLGFAALAVLTLLGTFLPVFAAEEYEGMDVSLYQENIDFNEVRASGRDVVYIKAGQADYEDPMFRTNAVKARQAGMSIGFYFFVTAENAAQAETQAKYFASLIRPFYYDCRPAVDFEQYGNMGPEQLNEIALAFSKTLAAETGIVPLFYTNSWSAEHIWREDLTVYPLWIAEYGVSHPRTGIWDSWAGFQYGSGRVSGVPTVADLDIFTDSVFLSDEEHHAAHGYPRPTPPDEPDTFDYTVLWGDTLWDLSIKYGTTVSELVELNDIENPNLIFVDQVLKIPVKG